MDHGVAEREANAHINTFFHVMYNQQIKSFFKLF